MADRLSLLRSILVTAPLVGLAVIVYGIAGIAVSLFDPTGDRQMRVARAWGRALCTICRVRVEVEGLDHIAPGQHYIFAPNHLSYIDSPVLLSAIPVNFRFMAKEELFRIPFLGTHLLRAGHISVPLEDPKASIRALSHAAKTIGERRVSVVIFPEGGRSENGLLQPFKEGAAYTAIKAAAPILPVALCGTRAILPMHSLNLRGGTVKVRFGEPIDTSGMRLQARGELTERVRLQIVSLLEGAPVNTRA